MRVNGRRGMLVRTASTSSRQPMMTADNPLAKIQPIRYMHFNFVSLFHINLHRLATTDIPCFYIRSVNPLVCTKVSGHLACVALVRGLITNDT